MSRSSLVAALSLLAATGAHAAVTYSAIADTNAIITGIRSDSASATSDSVVITANYRSGGAQYAGLYQGSLAGAATVPSASWHALTPNLPNATGGTFYGPNTARFTPSIGKGNVIAVGSYKVAGSGLNHGLFYQGPIDGSGTWKQIDASALVPSGDTLLNTIAHSTMGDLVVGNYDTQLDTGNAFIYNRITGKWTNLNPGGTVSVTAYGIWQNGPSSYTIAGGQGNTGPGVLDKSYLVDYDSATGALSYYRTFDYQNTVSSAVATHFDGITAADGGYNLTGFVTAGKEVKGFFASVRRKAGGGFANPVWIDVAYPGNKVTTGNTIIGNKVLGITVDGGTQSYIANVRPVLVTVKKSGRTATFTVRNAGAAAARFRLTADTDVSTSPVKAAAPGYRITYTLDGVNRTGAFKSGGVTVNLDPGATAQVVETAAFRGKPSARYTIRTALKAASIQSPGVFDTARVRLALRAK